MNTVKDLKNTLLKRREIEIVLTSDKNPGMVESTKVVADKFKANEEVIVVKKVDGRFGRNTFHVEAFIYESVEDKNRVEPRKKVKKEGAK